MRRYLSRFRISLLELFGLVTASAIAVAFVLSRSIWLLEASRLLFLGTVLCSISLGFGLPARRPQFLSYAFAAFGCYFVIANDMYLYYFFENTFPRAKDVVALTYSITTGSLMADTAAYHIAMAAGLLCAWLTRSLSRPIDGKA